MAKADMFDPFHDRAKKLLQQARNRRHYEKKKRLQEVQARLADRHAAITGLDRAYEPMGPLLAPKKLPLKFETTFTTLNRRLLAWGYVDDQRDFVAQSEQELAKVRTSPRLLSKWARAQDNWLLEGHALLEDMEKLIANTICLGLNNVEIRELWRNITDVAFRMQWMIVGIEYTIGTMDQD